MITRRIFLLGAIPLLTACLAPVGSLPMPTITAVEVYKADRVMTLLSNGIVVRRYDIDLGTNPIGPKRQRGDGKTPEGDYYITHVNTQSQFTLSLGINYPNEEDLKISTAAGLDPGDEIFFHGLPNGYGSAVPDWTDGCIAVGNSEIREIVSLVPPGTPVTIYP